MNDIIFTLLLGLGLGSLYAMLGAGLVVSYKGSGVINFAYGAMAMYGMFTFDTAWNRGELFFPWVDFLPSHGLNIPTRITLSDSGSWPMTASLVLALAMAVLIGLGAHFLVFRPLRNAAPLGKVVASLGLALYLQGVALINFGNAFPQPRSVVPDEAIENFLGLGKTFPRNALYVVAFTLLLGLVLWAIYRFTRFGLATRAAAGNEKGAVLLGYSPQKLAAVNWVLASVAGTLAVIVVGPIQGTITPIGLTALIVPALAAALIGGLRSVPIAVAGGLALGSVQTLLDVRKTDWFTGNLEWLQNGVRSVLPLVVIIVVLFVRGKSLPIRGTVQERRLPLAPNPTRIYEHALVWVTVLALFAFVFENAGGRTRFANSIQTGLVISIVMLSIVLLTGYTGQISLAQMSFAGIAAFVMARMMADGIGRGSNLVPVSGPGFPWPIAGLIGIIAAVIVGVVVGLPAVRIRGVQLAVVTIAAAVALQALYFENVVITQLRAGVPAYVKDPTIFGLDVGARSAREQNENPAFVIFAAIVLAACAVAVANVRRTGVGRRFLAVRANERAAAAAGLNVSRTNLLAFAMSAAIAGIGGLMLGFKQVEVSSANFAYGASLSVLAFAYLAGITSINGAIVAGMLLSALVPTTSNYFFAGTNIDSYIGLLSGLGIIVTAIIHPEGVAPFFAGAMRHAGNWLVTAIPGAATIRSAYRGSKQALVRIVLALLVIGFAVWVYNAKFVESIEIWTLISMVLLFIVVLAFARSLGPISPTFPEAGATWLDWAKRFGPTALVGYVLGWLIWPLRVDTYESFWMPLVGAGLALFIRSIYLQIRHGRTPVESAPPPAGAQLAGAAEAGGPISSTISTEVN
jgi:branched-subunit amino acid ABC-type transport system permease component